MNGEGVLSALDLPASSRVDRRVPKTLLLENGAPTPADRRHIVDRIEELTWVAALKPATTGVPEYRDDVREYLEIAVLRLVVRGELGTGTADAAATRLVELIHRAVPYPVVLVTENDRAGGTGLSVAHKRWSQGEAGKTVLDGDVLEFDWNAANDSSWRQGALIALGLAHQPRSSMFALYRGWADVVVAAQAATVTGTFVEAGSPERAAERLEALRECERLGAEISRIRAGAAREKQVARQVELNLALKRLEANRAAARGRL